MKGAKVKRKRGFNYRFKVIWVEECSDFGVDFRDWTWWSNYFPSNFLGNQFNGRCALVYIISANSNLEVQLKTRNQ